MPARDARKSRRRLQAAHLSRFSRPPSAPTRTLLRPARDGQSSLSLGHAARNAYVVRSSWLCACRRARLAAEH
eukprot:1811333-Prymnesium_polylepis.1